MQKTALYPLFPHFLRNSSESIRIKLSVSFFVQNNPIVDRKYINCGKIAENTLFFPISSDLFIDKLFAGAVALQEYNSKNLKQSFVIQEIENHVAWHGHISGLEAQKLLIGKKRLIYLFYERESLMEIIT